MSKTGSRKWFKYTTDDNDIFAMQCDEGNQEALSGTSFDLTGADTTKYAVPSNVTKRMTYWGQGDSVVAIPAPDPETYSNAQPGSTIDVPGAEGGTIASNYSFIRKRPEVIRYPRPDDTGLNDGDIT